MSQLCYQEHTYVLHDNINPIHSGHDLFSVCTHNCLTVVVIYLLLLLLFLFEATPFYVSLGNLLPYSTAISRWSGSVIWWSRVIQWQRQRRTDTHFVTKKEDNICTATATAVQLWFAILQRNGLESFLKRRVENSNDPIRTDTFFFSLWWCWNYPCS